MTYIPIDTVATAINRDPAGRTRASQLTTLFDGKAIDADDNDVWQNTGTGTITFVENQAEMSVTSGQYAIRRGCYRTPYSSGKPQVIEMTVDNFDVDANTTKMMGYYSSSSVAPYNTVYDGVWLENDGTTIRLKAHRAGTETMNIPWTEWTNYNRINTYNWANFTVAQIDFLWLGGTEVRVFLKTDDGFLLAHVEQWAGGKQDTFIRSPAQSIRYELRSSTGTGNMNAICSQVATEGAIDQVGRTQALFSTAAVTTNIVGTIYVIIGLKLRADQLNVPVQISDASIANTTSSDFGYVLLLKSPTLSGALTYSNTEYVQKAEGTGQTVTSVGHVIAAAPVGATGLASDLSDNFLSYMCHTIDGSPDEYVLAYMPTSINQSVFGAVTIKKI